MHRNIAERSKPVCGSCHDAIISQLNHIQATMLTKTSITPIWVMANLVSYGLMAGAVVALNAVGAFD